MNCNPTLTADEFKTVHNALCELRTIYGMLDGVVREPITDKMNAAICSIEVGLKGAYTQDNEAFDRKWNHYRTVREQYGLGTTWSIYEVEDLDMHHPYLGAAYVVYTDHWGESGEVMQAINGPTWVDLYRAADAAIRRSGDSHHAFIEDFSPIEGQPGYLRLTTGS